MPRMRSDSSRLVARRLAMRRAHRRTAARARRRRAAASSASEDHGDIVEGMLPFPRIGVVVRSSMSWTARSSSSNGIALGGTRTRASMRPVRMMSRTGSISCRTGGEVERLVDDAPAARPTDDDERDDGEHAVDGAAEPSRAVAAFAYLEQRAIRELRRRDVSRAVPFRQGSARTLPGRAGD